MRKQKIAWLSIAALAVAGAGIGGTAAYANDVVPVEECVPMDAYYTEWAVTNTEGWYTESNAYFAEGDWPAEGVIEETVITDDEFLKVTRYEQWDNSGGTKVVEDEAGYGTWWVLRGWDKDEDPTVDSPGWKAPAAQPAENSKHGKALKKYGYGVPYTTSNENADLSKRSWFKWGWTDAVTHIETKFNLKVKIVTEERELVPAVVCPPPNEEHEPYTLTGEEVSAVGDCTDDMDGTFATITTTKPWSQEWTWMVDGYVAGEKVYGDTVMKTTYSTDASCVGDEPEPDPEPEPKTVTPAKGAAPVPATPSFTG